MLAFVDVIRVYDEVGKVIEAHEHAGDFKSLETGTYYRFHSLFAWL
jgi:hypothetical protein